MTEVKQEGQARTRQATKQSKPVIDMLLKCPRCKHPQHEYVYSLYDKPWIKCDGCQQLSPSGSWNVIAVGSAIS